MERIFQNGDQEVSIRLADLQRKMAQHIIAQADCYRWDEVQSIVTETKVGARRKTELLEKLRLVFSLS